jgi:hypothetical protein
LLKERCVGETYKKKADQAMFRKLEEQTKKKREAAKKKEEAVAELAIRIGYEGLFDEKKLATFCQEQKASSEGSKKGTKKNTHRCVASTSQTPPFLNRVFVFQI